MHLLLCLPTHLLHRTWFVCAHSVRANLHRAAAFQLNLVVQSALSEAQGIQDALCGTGDVARDASGSMSLEELQAVSSAAVKETDWLKERGRAEATVNQDGLPGSYVTL